MKEEDKKVHKISPHYQSNHIDLENSTLEEKISLFEDRIRGYIITPSLLLQKIYDDSILMIVISVFSGFEILEVYFRGESSKNKSKEFFKSSFERIFGIKELYGGDLRIIDLDKILDEIYFQVRIGLFHTGLPKGKVRLSPKIISPIGIKFSGIDIEYLEINPFVLVKYFSNYLSQYCLDLRDTTNVELRRNFEMGWMIQREEGGKLK